MEQAPYYTNGLGNPQEVIRLQKTIYGLKQSARKWYDKVTSELATLGIHALHSNHAVYKMVRGDKFVFIAIHIDDSTITGSMYIYKSNLKHSKQNQSRGRALAPLLILSRW